MSSLLPLDQAKELATRGQVDEAFTVLSSLDPNDPRVFFNMGWHVIRLTGNFSQAQPHLDAGRRFGWYGSPPLAAGTPIWDGETSLAGAVVLLRGEGGLGDEIANWRWAGRLAEQGAQVVLSAHASLASAARRVPGVAVVVDDRAAGAVQHDCWLPSMSGAGFFPVETLPYLTPHPKWLAKWSNVIQGNALKVGIRWAGNPKFEDEQHRRFGPAHMLGLARPGVQLYSFQRDTDMVDLPEEVEDLGPMLTTWEDTLAALSLMDILVTSCTSTAHAAAAMGVPTWVVVPILPYFMWALPGATSPWYSSVRLFRQEVFGEWEHPFAHVRTALEEALR